VEGQATMRGELFGIENLFQFSRTSILHALKSKYDSSTNNTNDPSIPFDTVDIIPAIEALKVDEVNNLIQNLANDNTYESPGQPNSAMEMLENMGINIKVIGLVYCSLFLSHYSLINMVECPYVRRHA
jgi:hypothetical protein